MKKFLKKIEKNFKKMLDNSGSAWYTNEAVARARACTLKDKQCERLLRFMK